MENARAAEEAGFSFALIYFHQVGPDQEGFFRFYADEVMPQVSELTPALTAR